MKQNLDKIILGNSNIFLYASPFSMNNETKLTTFEDVVKNAISASPDIIKENGINTEALINRAKALDTKGIEPGRGIEISDK